MANISFQIGDLVVCGSPSERSDLDISEAVGLYLIDRRRDGLVLFPSLNRSAWLRKENLRAIDADETKELDPDWILLVHRVVALVAGIDIALEETDDGQRVVNIACAHLDMPLLRRLETLLGDRSSGLEIVPGSMSRVVVAFPI